MLLREARYSDDRLEQGILELTFVGGGGLKRKRAYNMSSSLACNTMQDTSFPPPFLLYVVARSLADSYIASSEL